MARERAERNGNDPDTGKAAPNLAAAVSNLSIAEIRQLIALMNGGDLDEVVIERSDGLKLVLRKAAPGAVIAAGESVASLELETDGVDGAELDDEAALDDHARDATIEIGSPLVGVYRARVKPDEEKPLVRLGDVVREGQIVAAVEALNYVNEIESAAAGRVKEIFVRDGQPVEYGQPLLSIEPS